MTAETSNARGEWPERYACNGPEGTFWTDDAALANKLIGAAFDRDEWTVTDTQNPTGAAPSSTAETSNARGEWVLERLRGVLEHGKMGDKCMIAQDLVTAAIAALSAQQSPAEAQPVATLVNRKDADGGKTTTFIRPTGLGLDLPLGEYPLHLHPPPSAPVGVEGLLADLETIWHSVSDDKETNAAYQRLKSALAQQPAAPVLAKYQPCGCVICTCEDEQQCQGCGAKHCGNRADHPPYVAQQPAAVDETAREDATPPATSPVRILIDAIESEIRQLEGKADWKSQTARIASLRAALDAALAAQHQEPTTCKHDFRRDEDHGGACCQLCGEVRQ